VQQQQRPDQDMLMSQQGFCPCEEHCTNQVFTKKQYAQLEVVSAGSGAVSAASGAQWKEEGCQCCLRWS
jgi:hypothetical protein